ncbi:hypothetical protein Hanom_Chr07g00612611 [Helianthus anomalus]
MIRVSFDGYICKENSVYPYPLSIPLSLPINIQLVTIHLLNLGRR